LGGLTTYLRFNYETTALAAKGAQSSALINIGVTLIGCG
jgi:fluoride ion exporter CrcB/FEX